MRNVMAAVVGAMALLVGALGTASAQTQNPLAVPARPPRDSNVVDPKGTAVVRGRVTSLDSGRPLRRAQVSLNSPELAGQPKTASTDI